MEELKDKLKRYEILELLAKLANYKGLSFDIGAEDIKDGRIFKIRNIKIEEIELNIKLDTN